ncbi:tRNA pseudouridine(55) synthase TruB [Capnocytophaga sp. HP1101]
MITPEEFNEGRILLIDKPLKWSSFQAVNKIKWAILKHYKLKKIKIGHAGTLDPLASGLLVICTGKFTKKITEIQDAVKTYTGIITLGATTPSYDMETEENAHYPTAHITPELIEEVRQKFLGELVQTPPVFSAIKQDGKRLYELARKGKEIEVPKRTIYIHSFDIDASEFPKLHFEVVCSKGTYIRSLANDFGNALGSGGYLSALRRTQIGEFSVSDALTPDEFINIHIPKMQTKPIILTTVFEQFIDKNKTTLNDRFAQRESTLNTQNNRRKSINDVYEERERERLNNQQRQRHTSELNLEAIFPRKKRKKSSGIKYEFRYFLSMFSNTDKAIMLTLLILFGTVVTLMMIQLNNKEKEIMIEMALTPDDLPYEPPKLEEQTDAPDLSQAMNAKLTTNAYNQADADLRQTENFKTLDEIMAERASQEMESAKEELVSTNKMSSNLVISDDNNLQKTSHKTASDNKVNKNTLVKYALSGRTGNIPNPVFTCEKEGQVVIIITVDEVGRVIRTALDKMNSTTNDDCLIENSLLYASRARFNAVTGKKEQTGTITYIFQSKR